MSNVDSRNGDGMSRLQGGIQQGRQRIQNAQEISKVKKEVNQLSKEKGKLLVELGNVVYLEYRKGNVRSEEIDSRATKMEELDVAIHKQLVQLQDLTRNPNEGLVCECGTQLSESDQFCPNCGTKVIKPEELETETKVCNHCSHDIPVDANFCTVCGSRA